MHLSGSMVVANRIDVEVRDVADAATIVAIRQIVQEAFGHLVGAWHVQVSASYERGRWDIRIRGGFGHYLATTLAAPDRLAEGVERPVRAFLERVAPPLSIASRRPVAPTAGGSVTPFARPDNPRRLHERDRSVAANIMGSGARQAESAMGR